MYLASPGATTANRSNDYLNFMTRFPDCQLLHYFDARGAVCADDDDVGDRVRNVVQRLDEGFDVYRNVGEGTAWQRVRGVVDSVKRDVPSKKFRSFLGMVRLRGESRLYKAVVAVRAPEGRRLC